ncbi:hypothetical protein CEP53_008851 [Fusarium sp. AF-6]|nr:hypothetical protein CEP53_008851 [Fusarium sp. AF-6]
MGERTGPRILYELWSYVLVLPSTGGYEFSICMSMIRKDSKTPSQPISSYGSGKLGRASEPLAVPWRGLNFRTYPPDRILKVGQRPLVACRTVELSLSTTSTPMSNSLKHNSFPHTGYRVADTQLHWQS